MHENFTRNLQLLTLEAPFQNDPAAADPLLVYDGELIEAFGDASVRADNFRSVKWGLK